MKLRHLACCMFALSWVASAQPSEIALEIPVIETSQYHRPYVAVWVEDAQQQPVKLIALWVEKPDWLKDLRRFWRKIGRSNTTLVDAVSGATQKPGNYTLQWDGKDDTGATLSTGRYTLFVEAAREQGGRSLVKHEFDLPAQGAVIEMAAEGELGAVTATIR
ncbi:MAG: DUF2271 domain-containing protein [Gammaproteobacteria bacterium]|nr:DUF2271 domain-containing protein [Gammaproteobacteria bacterium]MBU1554142.1 DUF2271 domain-containing protein [Gammaproteobacteria bacterium]MBU2072338.1 DUF2271 domain-containing protein [Gammaproteobacteria bacterium]MBU2183854.1 DUF2271 domain-containing protein [Gammaproteobacteria bacterium]MBU2203934.1 DUF2271 domain-containing protein [Gammaproteobacteria bacterium]